MAKVNMDDLRPNSNKYKNDLLDNETSKGREKLKPVVKKGSVISTKKPLGQKFKDSFMGEDAKEVKDYLFFDIIVPGIKNAFMNTLNMLLFGEPYYDNRSRSYGRRDRERRQTYSYDSLYRNSSDSRRSERRHRERYYEEDDRVDYRHIVLDTRDDAEEVIFQMRERIRKEGYVTIAELFDLVDVPGNFNDNNWGWDDERDIGLRRISSGYLINVSEARYVG